MKSYYTFDDVQIVPKFSDIEHRHECKIDNSQLSKNFKIELPLVSAPMDTVTGLEMAEAMLGLGGIGFVHRFMSIGEQSDVIDCLKRFSRTNPEIPIGGTIGVTGNYLSRAGILLDSGVNVFLLDVAHGHHQLVKTALTELKKMQRSKHYKFDIIAGSVCTAAAAKDLIEWGADGIRVGVGNGSMCSTRIQTGVGLPSVSSIEECSYIGKKHGVPIMADGGIRTPGDVCKALGAGASTVMIGSLLAGTKESPGQIIKVGAWPNEVLQKKYRGSASLESKKDRGEEKNVEGVSRYVLYKGKIKRIVNDICDGLRSSMSYVGARTLYEYREHCEFIRVTNAGMVEAKPHGL